MAEVVLVDVDPRTAQAPDICANSSLTARTLSTIEQMTPALPSVPAPSEMLASLPEWLDPASAATAGGRLAAGAALGLDEVVLATQPIMLLRNFMQFVPSVGFRVLNKVGPKRTRAARLGVSMYELK